MELRINIFRLVVITVLVLTIIIGIFVLKHQNKVITELNEVLRQEQVDDSLQKTTDSIKYRQLQLKTFSDSMATAKLYRDRELELVKRLTNKKIKRLPFLNPRLSFIKIHLITHQQFLKFKIQQIKSR